MYFAMSEEYDETIEEIRTVRIALQRFAAEQTDETVSFHLSCLDVRLAAASERPFI